MKKPAYLFGPFVGELTWEFFRFAPYAIHIKKEHPNIPLIVLTRQSRFDIYGRYADILIPLRIPNDVNLTRECFRLESLLTKDYNRIANRFRSQYKKRFDIIEHYYPDLRGLRYKLNWQFPREKMSYDFKPRYKNKIIAKKFIKKYNIFIDNNAVDYYEKDDAVNSMDFFARVTNQINDYDNTSLGCIIEGLRICKAVVGNLDSPTSHLAVLLGKPLICVNNSMSYDSINLLNPLKTPIIFSDSIEEGIKHYGNFI